MAISAPRIFSRLFSSSWLRSLPAKVISPLSSRSGGSGRRRNTDSTVRVLPEPLSPTIPSFSPAKTSRSTPRTISAGCRCWRMPTATSRSDRRGSLTTVGPVTLGAGISSAGNSGPAIPGPGNPGRGIAARGIWGGGNSDGNRSSASAPDAGISKGAASRHGRPVRTTSRVGGRSSSREGSQMSGGGPVPALSSRARTVGGPGAGRDGGREAAQRQEADDGENERFLGSPPARRGRRSASPSRPAAGPATRPSVWGYGYRPRRPAAR